VLSVQLYHSIKSKILTDECKIHKIRVKYMLQFTSAILVKYALTIGLLLLALTAASRLFDSGFDTKNRNDEHE
jgi:hypothetical protein